MTPILLLAAFFPGVLMTIVGIGVAVMALGACVSLLAWVCSHPVRLLVFGVLCAIGVAAVMP